jgi:hypothetical protein
MEVEKLFELCEAAPFRELKVFLTDGRSFSVKHPDYVAIDGETITLYDDKSTYAEVIDAIAIVSVRHDVAG